MQWCDCCRRGDFYEITRYEFSDVSLCSFVVKHDNMYLKTVS